MKEYLKVLRWNILQKRTRRRQRAEITMYSVDQKIEEARKKREKGYLRLGSS